MKVCGEMEVYSHPFLTSVLEGSGQLALHSPTRFNPVPIKQEAVWTPGSYGWFWRREQTLDPDDSQTPNPRSSSL